MPGGREDLRRPCTDPGAIGLARRFQVRPASRLRQNRLPAAQIVPARCGSTATASMPCGSWRSRCQWVAAVPADRDAPGRPHIQSRRAPRVGGEGTDVQKGQGRAPGSPGIDAPLQLARGGARIRLDGVQDAGTERIEGERLDGGGLRPRRALGAQVRPPSEVRKRPPRAPCASQAPPGAAGSAARHEMSPQLPATGSQVSPPSSLRIRCREGAEQGSGKRPAIGSRSPSRGWSVPSALPRPSSSRSRRTRPHRRSRHPGDRPGCLDDGRRAPGGRAAESNSCQVDAAVPAGEDPLVAAGVDGGGHGGSDGHGRRRST